jgi:pimeloyl-ACP methyl ester carboxylesterase
MGQIAARLADLELPPLDQSIPVWPGRKVSVGAARLLVRTAPSANPDAEPALFVHGLGGASTNWTDLMAQLSPWLASEAIDLPGFGWSGPSPDRDYSLRAQAQVVIGYLESARRGPVHLVGNSMGGAICALVASLRPDLLRTLTLVSPAVPSLRPNSVEGSDPRMLLLALPGVGGLMQRRLGRFTAEQRVRATFGIIYGDIATLPPHRLEEAAAELADRSSMSWSAQAFVAAFRSIAASYLRGGSTWAQIGRIAAPTLLIWGDLDRLVDARIAPRAANTIPNSRLLILPGVGHVPMMEDPQSVARAVLALIEDTGTGADGRPANRDVRA